MTGFSLPKNYTKKPEKLVRRSLPRVVPPPCWHFLAQSLGMGLLSSFPATAPEMLGWYVLTFTERSASTRIYCCSISPGSIQGTIIYIFPRDGVVCKVVY